MEFIWWLIIGLIAGALARLLVPGRDPMGLLGTLLLGLAGSLLGGFVGSLLFDGDAEGLQAAGLIGSILGAIVLLLIWRAVQSRRGAHPLRR